MLVLFFFSFNNNNNMSSLDKVVKWLLRGAGKAEKTSYQLFARLKL